jgi:diguanylate cyclase (GGDEF)-like protein
LLYVIGTAFIVIIMSKERTALGHKTEAMTDPLTGIYNRRGFLEAGQSLMLRLARTGGAVSVLAFDLDHFKSINDRFGHSIGDDVLCVFAATARNNTRATDVLGRLGGEEFAALLPGGAAEAQMVGERLRAAFEAAGVEIAGCRIGATVSIGAATAKAPIDVVALLQRADAALYAAKAAGRNRIVMAPDAATPADVPGAAPQTVEAALAR